MKKNTGTSTKATKKSKKAPVECVAWRLRAGDNDEHVYRLQTSNVDGRSADALVNLMKAGEWTVAGEISQASGSCDYIFAKTFSNEQSWLDWAKTCPYTIKELTSTGDNYKRIINKTNESKTTTTKKKRKISTKKSSTTNRPKKGRKKSNKMTDNMSNTTPTTTVEAPEAPAKRKRGRKPGQLGKCTVCGQYGHNKRTCPTLKTPSAE